MLDDPTAWLTTAAGLLYMVLYPFIYLISLTLTLLHWLATPFLKLGSATLHIILLPLRILAKFQALFIYFSVAILTGATLGVILYFICTSLVDLLHFSLGFGGDSYQAGKSKAKGKGRRDFSAVKYKEESSLGPGFSPNEYLEGLGGGKDVKPLEGGRDLFFSPILEEDEYSQGSNA